MQVARSGGHDLMTDRIHLSRRRLITAMLGASAGAVALDRVVAALGDDIYTAAGPLNEDGLRPADRILPTTTTTTTTTTTLPPPPPGQIAFPIDAQEDCWISDNFGDCRGTNCSRSHEGLDIMGSRNADLYAVVTGRLIRKNIAVPGRTYGAGNGWSLYDETTDITYKYFHMATHTEGLEVGDMVNFGDVIGTVGNTGTSGANSDSNYHLHFEYRPGNVAQDPRPLLYRHPNCTFYDG